MDTLMENENYFPRIFVISLKNSPRRDVIRKHLNSLGLHFEFFDAIYGKDLSEEQLSKIDYNFYPKNYGARSPLTLGEIGCAISHIKLYEHIINNNIPEAIIFEDDVFLHLYFKKILMDALNKTPKNKEILFLYHGKGKIFPFPKNLIERYKLAKYIKPSKSSKRCIIGAAAYLITCHGAKKLLEHAYPIRMPADFLTGLIQITRINAYGVEPSCVFTGAESEIDSQGERDNK